MDEEKGFFGLDNIRLFRLNEDGTIGEEIPMKGACVNWSIEEKAGKDEQSRLVINQPVSGEIEFTSRYLWALLSGRWDTLWAQISRILDNRRN